MSMSSSPATDLSWLYGGLAHVLEVLGLGGLGFAWRANYRVTKLEGEAAALKELSVGETLTLIREKVASLPTREEMDRRFEDLKQDFRVTRD
jgi:ABC-type lipopolysaccharide export system ATPase subunit